ncbi:MAG: hypothetical protein ABIK98_09680 [Pseudomonadota bacterium]
MSINISIPVPNFTILPGKGADGLLDQTNDNRGCFHRLPIVPSLHKYAGGIDNMYFVRVIGISCRSIDYHARQHEHLGV